MRTDNTLEPPDQTSGPVLECLARSRLYKVLSLALAPPETTILNGSVKLVMLQDLARIVGVLQQEVGEAARRVEQALEHIQNETEQVRREYEYGFSESTSGHYPLYETEYASPHVFAKTQTMADIAGFYRAFGVRSSIGLGERPDQASTELEFMHLVTLMEANASSKGDKEKAQVCLDAERKFIQDHMGRWLQGLGKLITETATTNMYRSLGRLVTIFLNDEIRRLGAKPEEVLLRRQRPLNLKNDDACDFGTVRSP